jgi:hypothetical protein
MTLMRLVLACVFAVCLPPAAAADAAQAVNGLLGLDDV